MLKPWVGDEPDRASTLPSHRCGLWVEWTCPADESAGIADTKRRTGITHCAKEWIDAHTSQTRQRCSAEKKGDY